MNIETLRAYCLTFPGAEEDVKWGNDLCFCVAKKMFCVTGLQGAFSFSLKVTPEEFAALTQLEGVLPAPYSARYHWILVKNPSALPESEWREYILRSYEMVRSKLPKKVRAQLGS